MNIFLIPFTWHRHLVMGWWCAGAALVAWWLTQWCIIKVGVDWGPDGDGLLLLSSVGLMIAGANTLGELNLRRASPWSRTWRTMVSALITGLSILFCWWLWGWLRGLFFDDLVHSEHLGDGSVVSLSYYWGLFAMVGLSSGFGPLCVRKFRGWISHLCGGLAAGLCGAILWHLFGNSELGTDLYVSSLALSMLWGFLYGLLVWGIPTNLYAGWIRVMSAGRYGRRIPIDQPEGGFNERFVGHFPRGLDLFLEQQEGVSELHVAVVVDDEQHYFVRGLSQRPTLVRRFLEKVDLRYDPRRPAPLQTRLQSGDHLRIGDGQTHADLEFLMLPREEK